MLQRELQPYLYSIEANQKEKNKYQKNSKKKSYPNPNMITKSYPNPNIIISYIQT